MRANKGIGLESRSRSRVYVVPPGARSPTIGREAADTLTSERLRPRVSLE